MSTIKLILPAKQANPGPPIGPSIGQYGLRIDEFCKQFNSKTKKYKNGVLIPVKVNVESKKSFDIKIKLPSNTYFIKKAATKYEDIMFITLRQIYEIASCQKKESNLSLKSLCTTLISSAKSMNVHIVSDRN